MRKHIKKVVEVETIVCDICGKEININSEKDNRIAMIKYLFNTKDFDAHEVCINSEIRATFQKYFKK